MVKKFKTLIFSMTFLTCSAFSVHAMFSEEADLELNVPTRSISPAVDSEEEGKVEAFFSRYPFFKDDLITRISSEVKGKAFDLNEWGVPNLDFTAALLLYSDRRDPEEFGLLFDLFHRAPSEKRGSLWENLNAFVSTGSQGAHLCEFYYDADANIRSSSRRIEGVETLKGKLFNLPHQ